LPSWGLFASEKSVAILKNWFLLASVLIWLSPSSTLFGMEGTRTFRVTSTGNKEASGRLIVFLISESSSKLKGAKPVDGPFWNDPQPLFGTDATLAPDKSITLDDRSDFFPIRPSQLSPGIYRAQARLDTLRANSSWKREPTNQYSDVVSFEVKKSDEPQVIELVLNKVVGEKPLKQVDGVEWFAVRSDLLSKFRGSEVTLRAGVVFPKNYNASKKYPVIFEVPGFGGDHSEAASRAAPSRSADSIALALSSFRIVLDPEGPNGHNLFVDSANNGPCGQALTQELIPSLEAKYPMIGQATARVLQGHSSGGWSTLWLATQYPKTFGATWSSAPDPVDFRRFQKVNIYAQPNFYLDAEGKDLPSLRSNEKVQMTIRQESRGEDVLGPDNTSAQQWDSWFAAFGPRNAAGNPTALFDPETGTIDREVAETYRQFDLREMVRKSPETYLPIFRNNIRLICGTEDSFYLNEAVALLDSELQQLGRQPSDKGYVKLVPGDHGSVFSSEAMQAIPKEILEHFKAYGHAVNETP
jgi:S-formylglutathione hydrolase FrmB